MFRSQPLTLKNRWDFTAGETGDDRGTDGNTNRHRARERERWGMGVCVCACVVTTFLASSVC